MRAGLRLCLVACALLPALARAQTPVPKLEPGARVRVQDPTLGKRAVVGRLVALNGDTLTFASEMQYQTPMRVLLDHRSHVELSVAHHSGLLRGLLIGGAVGGSIGGIIVGMRQFSNDIGEGVAGTFGGTVPHETVSQAPFYIGLGVGLALGALIGGSSTVDRWVPVSLPARMAFGGTCGHYGELRLAVSLVR